MKLFRCLTFLAAFWLVAGTAAPVFSADTQVAQGKQDKVKSKGKGAAKSGEVMSEKSKKGMQENDQLIKGRENALGRGEGEKTGLTRQMEEGAKAKKPKGAKKAK